MTPTNAEAMCQWLNDIGIPAKLLLGNGHRATEIEAGGATVVQMAGGEWAAAVNKEGVPFGWHYHAHPMSERTSIASLVDALTKLGHAPSRDETLRALSDLENALVSRAVPASEKEIIIDSMQSGANIVIEYLQHVAKTFRAQRDALPISNSMDRADLADRAALLEATARKATELMNQAVVVMRKQEGLDP